MTAFDKELYIFIEANRLRNISTELTLYNSDAKNFKLPHCQCFNSEHFDILRDFTVIFVDFSWYKLSTG